jgi:hypothetical protein
VRIRAVLFVVVAGLAGAGVAGCLDFSTSDPAVSVQYFKHTETTNGVTRTTVTATLTGVEGIADWNEIAVSGCTAPSAGTIEVPHRFAACSGRLRIVHVETGDALYDSG